MISVRIDGVEFEALSNVKLIGSFDAAEMGDVDRAREVKDVEVDIECDSTAVVLFGGEGYLHARERFNASRHVGEICSEGVVVFRGDATLRTATRRGDGVVYGLRIRRSGAEWAESASKSLLSDLEVDFATYLTEYNITSGWGGESIVKFLPVHRDSYSDIYSSSSSDVVVRNLSIDSYHPFINIGMVLEKIFSAAGYSVESSFLESESFKRLYMSGAYSSQNSERARTTMDFYVTKIDEVYSTADYRGRVSMSPYIASNTVGNFVDVESIDTSAECYSRSSCVAQVDGALRFTPITQVNVGFEYRFRYITEYRLKSRSELTAFDTFYLESGGEIHVPVANRFEDQREKGALSKFEYMVMVFDGDDSSVYRLYIYDGDDGVEMVEWSGRSKRFVSPLYSSPGSVSYMLAVSHTNGNSFEEYDEDWALYQGYVKEQGTTEVEAVIRTPPESVSPASPKTFGAHYVDGADEGMYFQLLRGTSLRPYFASYPGVGQRVEFEDLAQLGIYQSRVVEAVQQLFNLRIFTDQLAKKIYIEPYDELYDNSSSWDWSSKIVPWEEVVYEDVACDVARSRRWAFQQADGASTRAQEFGYEPGETYPPSPVDSPEQSVDGAVSDSFGSWRIAVDNYGAKQSSSSSLSPLFSPTLNDTLGLPIVGDRDDVEIADTMEFSPRVVALLGMQNYYNQSIPYAAFHSPSYDFTLCFEDRDGMEGLNRYYRSQIEREAVSQYVTLKLSLSPMDVAALHSPVEGMAGALSRFRFEIDGEWCECWLESLRSYDFGSGVAVCRFLIIK